MVDQIRGRCSDGQWLSKCGGNGGGQWSGSADTRKISVKSGSLIDQFNGRGGNGGGAHTLDCGGGFKITGYRTRCGSLIDRIQLQCTNLPCGKGVPAPPKPTERPTPSPTHRPSTLPTATPSVPPTLPPTLRPSASPTNVPTASPGSDYLHVIDEAIAEVIDSGRILWSTRPKTAGLVSFGPPAPGTASSSAATPAAHRHDLLFVGDVMQTSNGACKLTMQDDGNVVLINKGRVSWATETNGRGVPPYVLQIQSSGNLVVQDMSWNFQNQAIPYTFDVSFTGGAPYTLLVKQVSFADTAVLGGSSSHPSLLQTASSSSGQLKRFCDLQVFNGAGAKVRSFGYTPSLIVQ